LFLPQFDEHIVSLRAAEIKQRIPDFYPDNPKNTLFSCQGILLVTQ
jgi:hypothetical protein